MQALRAVLPSNRQLASLQGMSLGFLGGSLRDLKRPIEALARYREGIAVYESMIAPQPIDLYNMACCLAMVSALDVQRLPEDREKLQARAVACLRRAIEGNTAQSLTLATTDRDLDPLRGRAHSCALMADAIFPRDPFATSVP